MTQTPLPKYLDEAELEAAIHGIAKHHANRNQLFMLSLVVLGLLGVYLRANPITPKSSELQQQVAPKSSKLAYPVNAPITSGFGYREHPISGGWKLHAGVDFGAAQGTPIVAAGAGKVTLAGWVSGYGNSVEIDHGNGIKTFYAHASALYVKNGQEVQEGQAIAAIGSTGNSTGPHLHFEVEKDGAKVDPMKFLAKEDGSKSVGKAGKK